MHKYLVWSTRLKGFWIHVTLPLRNGCKLGPGHVVSTKGKYSKLSLQRQHLFLKTLPLK